MKSNIHLATALANLLDKTLPPSGTGQICDARPTGSCFYSSPGSSPSSWDCRKKGGSEQSCLLCPPFFRAGPTFCSDFVLWLAAPDILSFWKVPAALLFFAKHKNYWSIFPEATLAPPHCYLAPLGASRSSIQKLGKCNSELLSAPQCYPLELPNTALLRSEGL